MNAPASSTAILEAAQELHAQGEYVTRHTLAELTGLPLTTVDDRLRNLVEDGQLKRLVRGV